VRFQVGKSELEYTLARAGGAYAATPIRTCRVRVGFGPADDIIVKDFIIAKTFRSHSANFLRQEKVFAIMATGWGA
jgi:hypothetical protein